MVKDMKEIVEMDYEMTRVEKEQYLAESIAELESIEITETFKSEISKLTDVELDEKVDWAFYLEGK
jgi:hypothetical protein